MAREIDRHLLVGKLEDPQVRLLDVQGPGWYEREHLPGAIRGSLDDPERIFADLGDDRDVEVVVYCYSATCTASELAVKLLEGHGYRNVWRYSAGKQDWIDAGLPLASEA